MQLGELMRPRVVTIESTESANAAWNRMQQNRIRHLVVMDDGELAGVVSERDLGGRAGGDVRRGRTVADLMSSRVVSATPTMTLRKAANLMRSRLVGSLPVLDDERVVGIVTATDVLEALGRGSARPPRRPEHRTERMTESRRRAARKPAAMAKRARASRAGGRASRVGGRERSRIPDSPRRAPFAQARPKAAKVVGAVSDAALVPAYIGAGDTALTAEDREYIRRKLGRRLGKFSEAIERVSVRLEDVNGPRGGVDQVCRIKVVLGGMPSVVFEAREATARAAFDLAVGGVERAVRRAVQKRRMRPLKRAA
jgi:CBS domain-containing protein